MTVGDCICREIDLHWRDPLEIERLRWHWQPWRFADRFRVFRRWGVTSLRYRRQGQVKASGIKSALQIVALPAELFSNVDSVSGHLHQQPGLADVAQVGGEEPGRERAPHQVEQEGGLHVAPRGGLA